jgi:hypothetical protein
MPDTKNVIDALTSRPLALTTFRLKDADSANRYQTAIARGDDELLFWGLGPRLEVGNLVALYVPNSTFVPRCDRMTISRVYSVSHIIEGRKWPNYVYLGQPLVFDPFRLEDLRVKIGLSDFEIRDSGSKKNAWEKARAQKFWSFILKRQANLETVARERLLQKHLESRYDVAISYAGPDWTEARRLKRWFDHEGLQTFFATSVGTLNNEGRQTLPELLRRVYRQSRVAIFLTPPPDFMSEWIRIELEAARESANRVILVRFDTSRKWQLRPSRKVERLDYKPPEEDLVVKRVLSHLRNIGKMQGSSGRGASLQPIGPGPFDG